LLYKFEFTAKIDFEIPVAFSVYAYTENAILILDTDNQTNFLMQILNVIAVYFLTKFFVKNLFLKGQNFEIISDVCIHRVFHFLCMHTSVADLFAAPAPPLAIKF